MFVQYAPFDKIAVFAIDVVGLSLIITVLIANVKTVLKRIFTIMTILMFIWVNFAFLARLSGRTDLGLLFIRLAWAITPLLFVLVFTFITNFLEFSSHYRVLGWILYAVGITLIPITLLTNLIISGIRFERGTLNIDYGLLVWAFFGTVAALTVINFYLLIIGYGNKRLPKETVFRVKFLLAGLTFFFVANAIFNIIYPVFFRVFNLYEFGDYSTIFFLALIAYAIVRRQMLGAKVVVASFAVSFLGSFLLIDALIFSQSWIQGITKSAIFIFYIPFGYLLLRSVLQEVKQREKLEELAAKLKALDQQKDEFISMAAHELRAPMTAIKGYVSMVVEGDTGEISEKARGFLADANAINDRLIRLVNNMLNVSRIEEGRMVFQDEDENLSQVVRAVFAQFRPEAERKGLKLILEIPSKIKDKVHVDPDRIHEVVGNLMSNAVKYTEKGSVLVKMSQSQDGKAVRLEVIDTGPGISDEEQTKLFKKFSRAESSVGKTTGTGLGLYISKLLVEKFGGKIGLESEPGKGSNFWIELPLVT